MEECVFCRIASKKLPAEIVYEDKEVLAFEDLGPQAPVHILVIPKKHLSSQMEAKGEDFQVIGRLFEAVNKIAEGKDLSQSGFRVVTNCGRDAGQAVLHLHFHLLGGRKLGWPPG